MKNTVGSPETATPSLTIDETRDWLKSGKAVLVDVREQEEFETEHIDGAVLVPASAFAPAEVLRQADGRKIVFQCLSGRRAGNAQQIFITATGQTAWCMIGSLNGWKEAGLPTIVKKA